MALGLVGKKLGMSRIFTEAGESIPVTVVLVEENRVSQVKSDKEGYNAVQVAAGSQHPARLSKAEAGHLAKAGVEASSKLCEFRVEGEQSDIEPGKALSVDIFSEGQFVDVTGVSIGKGFAGAIKRHNFGRHPMSHGASKVHRAPGSIGMCQTPGRVFKGKKMPGHYGNVQKTIQNLSVVKVDGDRNLLLIKGACPGSKGGYLVIKPAVKKKGEN